MDATPPDPVAAAIDAVNRGDTDSFLAAFADDGTVDDFGREFTGHPAIRGWSDGEFIGQNATLAVTSVSDAAEGVVVVAQVGGDGFNGPSTFTFDLDGDQVARMTIRE
jgi:hypothetical protein